MRETRLSGSEGGAGSIPVPTPIVAWAFQPMSGRRTEGGGLAHGTHGTHGRIFDRRERRGRTAEGGGRRIGREEAQKAQNRTESQVSSGLGSSPVKRDQAAQALGATHFSREKAQEAEESEGGMTEGG